MPILVLTGRAQVDASTVQWVRGARPAIEGAGVT